MSLKAGRLRHWVDIEKPVTTQDPVTGEKLVTWTRIASTYAEVVPNSVREFIAAAAEQSLVAARITIRHRTDIDATMRIIHRGLAYQVLGVLADPDSGLEYITLPVSEGVRVT